MANCTITGTVKWNTLPKAGVTVYARIEKTGEVQFTEAQRVATSDAAGLVTFDLPQSCIAYIEGEFQCGATNFDVQGGVALTIPAAASATLESLSAAVTFPSTGAVVQDDGVALANPISTFNYGTGLTAVESSPGVALLSAAGAATFLALTDTPATYVGQALKVARVNAGETALEFSSPVSVTAEEIQDALVNFFPDIAPFDWTYDDAGDRVTLNILDATSGARGLMSTAYAARLDQLEVGDAPTFAGLTLSGLTQGSIPFAGAGGLISQDNAALFWDATNDRLGVNKAVPVSQFHVLSNAIGVIPLIAEGPAGQTANLFEARVNGAVRGSITTAGLLSAAGQVQSLSGGFQSNAAGYFYWAARCNITSPVDGTVRLTNAAESGFTSLQFFTDTSLVRGAAGRIDVGDGAANANGIVNASAFRVANTKVVGAQGAAVIDATDNPSAITQLNALLARMRAHGLIA